MKLKLKINSHTTAAELIQLGMLFTGLGLNQGAKVVSFSPLADEAELDEPEVVVVPEEEAVKIDAAVGNEPPKRRRRTKAEIEAEAEATRIAEAEAAAQVSNEAGLAAAQEEAGNAEPSAPTPTANATATETATQEPAASAPATESPSDGKTYTAAEVQQLATVVARTHGADLVKGKIAELGGSRIAELSEQQVNQLGAFLSGVK